MKEHTVGSHFPGMVRSAMGAINDQHGSNTSKLLKYNIQQ